MFLKNLIRNFAKNAGHNMSVIVIRSLDGVRWNWSKKRRSEVGNCLFYFHSPLALHRRDDSRDLIEFESDWRKSNRTFCNNFWFVELCLCICVHFKTVKVKQKLRTITMFAYVAAVEWFSHSMASQLQAQQTVWHAKKTTNFQWPWYVSVWLLVYARHMTSVDFLLTNLLKTICISNMHHQVTSINDSITVPTALFISLGENREIQIECNASSFEKRNDILMNNHTKRPTAWKLRSPTSSEAHMWTTTWSESCLPRDSNDAEVW